jgi:hypothetical protein
VKVDRTFAIGLDQLRPQLPLVLRRPRGGAAAAAASGAVVWFLLAGSVASSKFPGVLLHGSAGVKTGFAVLVLLALGAVAAVHAGTLEVRVAAGGVEIRRWFGLSVRRRPLGELRRIRFLRLGSSRWIVLVFAGGPRLAIQPPEPVLRSILDAAGAPEL